MTRDDFLSHLWMLEITGIVFATLLLFFVEQAIYRRIYPRLVVSQRMWDDALFYAIHRPLQLYLLFSGGMLIAALLFPALGTFIAMCHNIGALALFLWSLVRCVKQLERNYVMPKKLGRYDLTTMSGIIQILKVFVFVVAILALLQLMGVPLSGVIAFGGIGGIAVGFAAKDLLANFFGGLMIFLDRPFKIGDWIRSPDRNIEGTVEHIGWRVTRIRTNSKRALYQKF